MMIVEVARYRVIYVESQSAFVHALEAGLANYDSVLFEEYGIFAGSDKLRTEEAVTRILDSTLLPSQQVYNEYLVDYLISDHVTTSTGLQRFLEPSSYNVSLSFQPLLSNDLSQIKTQTVNYMKERKAQIILRPFLDDINLISKTTKSSKIINEKNDLVASVEEFMNFKRSLILLIDGFEIKDSDGSIQATNKVFIRQYTEDVDYNPYMTESLKLLQKERMIENRSEFDALIRAYEKVNKIVDRIVELAKANEDKFTESHNNDFSIDDYLIEYKGSEMNINTNRSSVNIYTLEDDNDESVNSNKNLVEEDIGDPEETKEVLEIEAVCGDPIIENYINRIKEINDEEIEPALDKLSDIEELLELNRQALKIIEDMSMMSSQLLEDIESFQEKVENDDQLMDGLISSLLEDTTKVKAEINTEEYSLEEVNNLVLIKERIEENVEILEEVQEHAAYKFFDSNFIYNILEETMDNQNVNMLSDIYLKSLFKERVGNYKRVDIKVDNKIIKHQILIDSLSQLGDILNKYDSRIYIDYRGYSLISDEAESIEEGSEEFQNIQLMEKIESILPEDIRFIQNLSSSQLPSIVYKENKADDKDEQEETISETSQENSGEFDLDTWVKELQEFKLSDFVDSMWMIEYMIQMTSNGARVNNPNASSLSGYKLSDHNMSYECEYIIFGKDTGQKNLDAMLTSLYGIRIPMNLLHIGMDSEKRTMIMSLANSIAGWWTGGVGGVIIGIVLALCWAIIESFVDIFLLVSGQRVPFVKLKTGWYTSLDGNWMDAFNTLVQQVQNQTLVTFEGQGEISKNLMEYVSKKIDDLTELGLITDQEVKKQILNQLSLECENLEDYIVSSQDLYLYALEDLISESLEIIDEQLLEFLENGMIVTEDELTSLYSDVEELIDKSKFKTNPQIKSMLLDLSKDYYQETLYAAEMNTNNLTLSDLVELRKKVLADYESRIDGVKSSLVEADSKVNDLIIETGKSLINKQVDKMIEKGEKIVINEIANFADDMKKQLLERYSDESLIDVNKDGLELDYIPKFAYEDYLRLFMISKTGDEGALISRFCDVLQLNLQKVYSQDQLDMNQYYVGYTGNLSVQLKKGVTQNEQHNFLDFMEVISIEESVSY